MCLLYAWGGLGFAGFRFRLWLSLFHFRLINYIIKLAAMGLKDSLAESGHNKSHVYAASCELLSCLPPFPSCSFLVLSSTCFCSLSWQRTHSISLDLAPLARSKSEVSWTN